MSMQEMPAPATGAFEPGELVDENTAAAILGVKKTTLQNWRWKGIGPRFHKIGNRLVRYSRADLSDYVRDGVEA